ncbi:MAG: glutathione peroxidase [Olpidium bornovanus]|uniref:Glutathione peroxidase n=1 Tax=Olpidium bornovanus TaxID=278681 RepID=A0A8H7ZQA8_9FUNG|nr:MAG: glutathione peroxidase [Olpidium bornovanus]
MKKVDVNGDNAHPVYQFLKSQKKQLLMERIKKFVVNRKGEGVNRYASTTAPDSMAGPIEELLAEAA